MKIMRKPDFILFIKKIKRTTQKKSQTNPKNTGHFFHNIVGNTGWDLNDMGFKC